MGDFNYDGKVDSADFGLLSANFGQQSNAAPAVLPAGDPGVVAAALSPPTAVDPLTSVGTLLTPSSAAGSSNIVLTDQDQDQSYIAPTDAVLNPDDKGMGTKSRNSHHPRG